MTAKDMKPGLKFTSRIPGLNVEVISYEDTKVGNFNILKVKALNSAFDVKKGEILEFMGLEGFNARYNLIED